MMKRIFRTGSRIRWKAPSLREDRKGFTLLEVLVAMAVLVFGISYMFPVFFESISSVRHIKNRTAAGFMMEDEIWNIKSLMSENLITDGYAGKRKEGSAPEIDLTVRLKKLTGFDRLYRMEMRACWAEGRRSITLDRVRYMRCPQ